MEILEDIHKKQEQLEKLFLETLELQKKQLLKPLPQPDFKAIASEIKEYLGDPSAGIRQAEQGIENAISKIPTSIKIDGDVLGFISMKSSIIYLSFLFLSSGVFGGISVWQKLKADKYEKLANSYESDFQKVKELSPKTAKKYLEILEEK